MTDICTEPDLIRRKCGGWLALTRRGDSLRIGVLGATEAEARRLYVESLEAWRRNLSLAASCPVRPLDDGVERRVGFGGVEFASVD